MKGVEDGSESAAYGEAGGPGISRKARLARVIRNGLGFSLRNRLMERDISWIFPSMEEFAVKANKGLVGETVAEHLSDGLAVDRSRFFVEPVRYESWPKTEFHFPAVYDPPAECYLDTAKGFVLGYRTDEATRDDLRVAVAGFGQLYSPAGVDILLAQNQAIKNASERQRELQRELYDAVKIDYVLTLLSMYWAKEAGVNRFQINKGEHNMWTKVPGHLSLERARLRYDVIAKRLGFTDSGYSFTYLLNPAAS